jgi:hypothetical protein
VQFSGDGVSVMRAWLGLAPAVAVAIVDADACLLRKSFLDASPAKGIRARPHFDDNGVLPRTGAVDMHLAAFDFVERSGRRIPGVLVSRGGKIP